MASITFEGPNLLNPAERASTVASFSDEALGAVVQALCTAYGYQPVIDGEPNPEGPGTFAINRILDFCRDHARAYATKQAQTQAVEKVAELLAPLDNISLEHSINPA